MGVTLTNIAGGGSVNVTLEQVIGYVQKNTVTFYKRGIPGKTNPSIDTTSFVMFPREYQITVLITDSQKVSLQIMQDEPDHQILLTDNELTDKNVRMLNLLVTARTGNKESGRPVWAGVYPWQAEIRLTAEDH
jgi:hypothetical protein